MTEAVGAWTNWFTAAFTRSGSPLQYWLEACAYTAPLYSQLVAVAPPPRRLVEIGCGIGGTATALAARGYEVLALDRDPAVLRLAREIGLPGPVTFHLGDTATAARLGPFDVATCLGVVEHASPVERMALLTSLHSLAAVQVVCIPSPRLNALGKTMGEHDLSLRQLVGECRRAGWRVVQAFGWGDPDTCARRKDLLPFGLWRRMQARGWCCLSLAVIGQTP